MRNFFKKLFIIYFTSWWLPFVVALSILLLFVVVVVVGLTCPNFKSIHFLGTGFFILLKVALVGILFAAIWNLTRKRWVKALINLLLMLPILIPFVFYFLLIYSLFGPSEDGFADKLTIPENIEISEPSDRDFMSRGGPEDTFQARLLASLKEPGQGDPSITAEVLSLVQLRKTAPGILRQYLAISPCWRVFKEKDSIFATRRWMIGSNWCYSLHGYYSRFDLGFRSNDSITDFQTRLTLGFSGRPWARFSGESTSIRHGQSKRLALSGRNQTLSSHCVIMSNDLAIEIFEQSGDRERRLTKATLLHMEEELRPLAVEPEFSTIQSMLPYGAIRNGQPTIELWKSFQPGIYDSEIWVNPGEPGMIYLKAYELTRGIRLSAASLKKYSNELIGWSDDSSQLFFSNTHFTIYEGDWGKPYAARFEVWFVPDSGEPERKLMEKIFKVEGWQR